MNSTNQVQLSDKDDIGSIILSIQNGNVDNYRKIIEKYQRQIYVYCYHLLKQNADVEDAVQEIFIKAYEHIHQYEENATFSAWLYKIAYNHCLNLNKRKLREIALLQTFKNNDDMYTTEEKHSEGLEKLINHLSIEEKNILLLRVVEKYTFEEIGHVIKVSPATARKKYERIKKKLIKKEIERGYLYEESLESSR